MKDQPTFTPPDRIFDPNPRFDELPAARARRKRRRLTVALVVLIALIVLSIAAYSLVYQRYTAFKGEIDATMTAVLRP